MSADIDFSHGQITITVLGFRDRLRAAWQLLVHGRILASQWWLEENERNG